MPTWKELSDEISAVLADHETRIVLEEVAHAQFAELITRFDDGVDAHDEAAARALVARRLAGEPLQHLVGHWPFRTIDLRVDARALIPRPETEIVVENGLSELRRHLDDGGVADVLDLGTGTGAIALSIVAEEPRAKVIGIDVDERALQLATENRDALAATIGARVQLVRGDFFAPLGLPQNLRFSLVIANPPYLAEAEWATLDPVVRDYDPRAALIAGATGLEAIDRVFEIAREVIARPGSLVMEIAPQQRDHVLERSHDYGAAAAEVRIDLAGRDRVLVATWH